MTTPVHLFSYGTLQLPRVQRATFGRLLEGRPDAIVGYELTEVHIDDPHVVATSGSDIHPLLLPARHAAAEVPGMVFAISERELAAADEYEVNAYSRIEVTLRSGQRAWVYALGAAGTDPS